MAWFEEWMSKNPDMCAKFENRLFPFANANTPRGIVCHDCKGPGWGPMLTEYAWSMVTPTKLTRWLSGRGNGMGYLCEPCMIIRLGRPLRYSDLVDCPMNYQHPLFKEARSG